MSNLMKQRRNLKIKKSIIDKVFKQVEQKIDAKISSKVFVQIDHKIWLRVNGMLRRPLGSVLFNINNFFSLKEKVENE